MKPQVVIWGASGHALVVADIVHRAGKYELVACIDDVNPPAPGATLSGVPVYGTFADLRAAHPRAGHLLFGFGSCKRRIELYDRVRSENFTFATAIHPSAILADPEIGEGTVIAAGAIVNPAVKIGRNVIVNTGASIDHECVIEEGVHICPGVRLAGRVSVGAGAWIGIGSTVVEKIAVGAGAVVGAGSVVVRDIPSGVVAYGAPARARRKT